MSLARFFEQIGPYLLGQREYGDAAQRLYGSAATGTDAARLAIYGRFCGIHRREILESVYPYSHDAVVKLLGADAWLQLVERYYVAHPMHHFEFNQNGIYFPEFLAKLVEENAVPPFLGELGDFEWWEWLTDTRFDEPSDAEPDSGALRLHSSVDLRPYGYDLVPWIDDDERESDAPEPRQNVVLFYRDRQLTRCRERATGLQLLIIKAIVESVPLDEALATQLGISPATLQGAVAELREAGVILGAA